MLVFLQTLKRWVYMDPIHVPLDGPLYMGQHSHTPTLRHPIHLISTLLAVRSCGLAILNIKPGPCHDT